MQPPTAAPWARKTEPSKSTDPLPPVSRGETTTAPWARPEGSLRNLAPHSPTDISIPAKPRFPDPIQDVHAHTFIPASKRITNIAHLNSFLSSESATNFLSFILSLNESITSQPLSAAITKHQQNPSHSITSLHSILETLNTWIDNIPPAQHTLRYGNPAFREWFTALETQAPSLISTLLPPELISTSLLNELTPYFIDSFGNKTRIDYGTGHETTFIAFLYCLSRLGIYSHADCSALVAVVFARYLKLLRRIQTTYWLEPAGSHGVWGLDDYQFIPFLFGSAQLIDHPYLKPSSIFNVDVLRDHEEEYLYFSCVAFVMHVKSGPLSETSPMLCDIAGVPSWKKVNSGMVKMYQVEVLGKFPIMQHFLFGSLLHF